MDEHQPPRFEIQTTAAAAEAEAERIALHTTSICPGTNAMNTKIAQQQQQIIITRIIITRNFLVTIFSFFWKVMLPSQSS